ncbi:MAG: MFS transporter, partial [Bifidobacteriaceae bacterium]|nr:MFS transporter [Bifidobacteriaceae bacterium]
MHGYFALLALPGVKRFWAAGFLARFPNAMMGMAVTVLISGLYRQYSLAGKVSATMAIASAIGAPLIARLIDRHGQSRVGRPVLGMLTLSAALLTLFALLRLPQWTLIVAGALTGGLGLQFGTLVRTRWNGLLNDYARIHRAFSLESVADDICFVIAPSVAAALGTSVAPASAMFVAVALLLVGGFLFLAQRDTEPTPSPRQPGMGAHPAATALASAPVAVAFIAVGVIFGANSIAMVAMCEALGAKW